MGIDFLTKNVFLEDKTIRLIMWDTAGSERFKSLIPTYLRNAHAIILTFDITSNHILIQINPPFYHCRSGLRRFLTRFLKTLI